MPTRPYPISNVSSSYGAPMGRRNDTLNNVTGKLHLQYVPFVDGCYDQGGAYWGSPANLYVAWGHDEDEHLVEYYVRASSREKAKAIISDDHDVKFYR